MWLITRRDLRWRRRRFAIAIVATGMAFALTLVLSGILQHMRNESVRVVGMYPTASWLVTAGATGPFTTSQFVSTRSLDEVRKMAGVHEASPLLIVRSTIDRLDVNIVGYERGGLTEPPLDDGTLPDGPGQAIVDRVLDRHVGDTLTFAGRSYPVVGLTRNTSFYFSAPTVFLPIEDVQDQFLDDQELASTIIVTSDGAVEPLEGLDVLTSADVKADLDRPLATTKQTLDIFNGLLWIMAVGTVASMVYLTALERTRDFAVLKAIGTSGRSLALGLSLEAIVLSLSAAVVGMILALLIAPSIPFPVELTARSALGLLGVAMVVGTVASLVGVRRVAGVDPALAFGGQ
jgi:putative ABC transport system permease protein